MSTSVIETEPVPAYPASKALENRIERRAKRLGYVVLRARGCLPSIRGYLLVDEFGFMWGNFSEASDVVAYLDASNAAR